MSETFEQLFTYEELAERLSVSVPWIKKMKREEKLPHIKMGRLIRFRLRDVNKWIEKRKQAG